MTQLKRWGYITGAVDYKKVAEQVFLATECKKVMEELGHKTHASTYSKHTIMGKEFDPEKAAEYEASFKIRKA
jgi:nitrate/nitrite transport system substrate-binding protein